MITSQYWTFQKQTQPQLANTRPFRIRPSHMITSQYWTFQNQASPHDYQPIPHGYQPILDLSEPGPTTRYNQPILHLFITKPSYRITSQYFTFQNQVQLYDYQPILDLSEPGSAT
jgi:hypothetical protein